MESALFGVHLTFILSKIKKTLIRPKTVPSDSWTMWRKTTWKHVWLGIVHFMANKWKFSWFLVTPLAFTIALILWGVDLTLQELVFFCSGVGDASFVFAGWKSDFLQPVSYSSVTTPDSRFCPFPLLCIFFFILADILLGWPVCFDLSQPSHFVCTRSKFYKY